MTKSKTIFLTLTVCVAITATGAWLGWREFVAEPEFGSIVGLGFFFLGMGISVVIALIVGLLMFLKSRANSSSSNPKTHSDPI